MVLVAVAVVLASSTLLAVIHANDRFEIGWVQGTRMALAQSAEAGELYPPLYDGETIGGTRFMPLPIALHAAVAKGTGEFLLAGKLASYLSTVLLLGSVFVSLRSDGTRTVIALGLMTAVLATRPGFFAATTIQGDALPVLGQVAALGVINRSRGRIAVVTSAGLCSLAFFSKLSALWAPAAIVVWLAFRAPRRLWLFIGSFLGMLGLLLALLQGITHGRMVDNIGSFALSGVSFPGGVVRAPLRALTLIADAGPVAALLLLLAIVGMIYAVVNRGMTIYQVALPIGFLLLVAVASDAGALTNHTLDVVVLASLAVGVLTRGGSQLAGRSWGDTLVAVAVVWGSLLFTATDLERPVVDALRGTGSESPVRPLAGTIDVDDRILSEDPYVPVALGQRPVLLDAWALLRLEDRHPEWISRLAQRIRAHEFDKIVLLYDIGTRDWYNSVHLGETVAAAIRDEYRLIGSREGYYVYAPDDR